MRKPIYISSYTYEQDNQGGVLFLCHSDNWDIFFHNNHDGGGALRVVVENAKYGLNFATNAGEHVYNQEYRPMFRRIMEIARRMKLINGMRKMNEKLYLTMLRFQNNQMSYEKL